MSKYSSRLSSYSSDLEETERRFKAPGLPSKNKFLIKPKIRNFYEMFLAEFTTRSLEKKNAELSSSKYVLANQVRRHFHSQFIVNIWNVGADWRQSPPHCMVHQREGRQDLAEIRLVHPLQHVPHVRDKVRLSVLNLGLPMICSFLDSTNPNSTRLWKIRTQKKR